MVKPRLELQRASSLATLVGQHQKGSLRPQLTMVIPIPAQSLTPGSNWSSTQPGCFFPSMVFLYQTTTTNKPCVGRDQSWDQLNPFNYVAEGRPLEKVGHPKQQDML